ncbi:MAG: phage portal protein [Lachnospirales bacterium]
MEDLIFKEIFKLKSSKKYKDMEDGERYYFGAHDILHKSRMAIGIDGELAKIHNLPNNKILNNQYKIMVDQKVNYLLGKSPIVSCENQYFLKEIKKFFNRRFFRTLKNIGVDALNSGIGWLYIFYNEKGDLSFKRFSPLEVLPIWKDKEHSELEKLYRVFDVYDHLEDIVNTYVEIYTLEGVTTYEYNKGTKKLLDKRFTAYFTLDNYNHFWNKIPIVPFKYNFKEIPLLNMVKSLQDGINSISSRFIDHLEEDTRNTIMVLVNYDGENLSEFRHNLATYGVVKVSSDGDLKTLEVEVNCENYKVILDIFKKALIENACGYDAKDDRLQGNANQMNIKSMYSSIDLDANSMEMEFQGSLEEVLWFIKTHLYNNGLGDYEDEELNFIFNRDILLNESDIITDIKNSVDILSLRTLVEQHPYILNVENEIIRLQEEGKM